MNYRRAPNGQHINIYIDIFRSSNTTVVLSTPNSSIWSISCQNPVDRESERVHILFLGACLRERGERFISNNPSNARKCVCVRACSFCTQRSKPLDNIVAMRALKDAKSSGHCAVREARKERINFCFALPPPSILLSLMKAKQNRHNRIEVENINLILVEIAESLQG